MSFFFNPLKQLIFIISIGAGLMALGAYLSEMNQFFELLSHFRVQYCFMLLLCLLIQGLWKQKICASVTAGLLVLAAVPLLPYYLPEDRPNVGSVPSLKILQMNILVSNPNEEAIGQLVDEEKPDVIGIEELNPLMANVLSRQLKAYPYRLLSPRTNTFGIGLFSKRPLANAHIVGFVPEAVMDDKLAENRFPSIVATVMVQKQPITLIVTHPTTPMLEFGYRNAQLAAIAAQRKSFGSNVVVFGDLNITPWSAYFQNMLLESGLTDSQMGLGIQPSWPTFLPWPMRIPIDHILVSPSVQVLERRLGPEIGSDHRPVIAVLGISTSAEKAQKLKVVPPVFHKHGHKPLHSATTHSAKSQKRHTISR